MKDDRSGVAVIVAGLIIYLLGGFGVPAACSEGISAEFNVNSTEIAGFPTGRVALTGVGGYVLGMDAQSSGTFRCTESISQGPLKGCLAGQGVHWDAAGPPLASTILKCTGADSERSKTARTTGKTVVLTAHFYREGDGKEGSFTAKMVISEKDIAPDIEGIQTVWIEGVGCGTGIANFE